MTKLFYTIILLFLNLTCYSQESDSLFFNKSCQCDSVTVMNYDFIEEEDGNIYSIPNKESFNFKFIVDSTAVLIDNKKYHSLIVGIQKDTIGFVQVKREYYKYRGNLTGKDEILFNLKKQINDSWKISEDGYFKNYRIILSNITYDKNLNDSIYTFKCESKRMLPHGYSFNDFKVSKKRGIVGYSLEVDGDLGLDTINCKCQ